MAKLLKTQDSYKLIQIKQFFSMKQNFEQEFTETLSVDF